MRTPSLSLWRDEMRRGVRDASQFDVIWHAACLEAAALELAHIPSLAQAFLNDARDLVLRAAQQQRRAATR